MAEPARRVPYVPTALVLVSFFVVSAIVPWSRMHFPADLPPLFVNWDPSVGPGIVLPLLVLGGFLLILPRLGALGAPALLTVLVGVSALTSSTLAMQSGHIRTFTGCCRSGSGASLISVPFERDGEYLAAVPLIDRLGPRSFAERFDELVHEAGTLPLHVQTHPPGGPMFLWVLSEATGGSTLAVALLTVAIGALGVVPTHAIAKAVYGERVARNAAILFAVSPGVLVYSATSMDVVFMTVVATALALLVRAPTSIAWAAAAGAAAAVAACFTWGALALGPIGVGVGLLAIGAGEPVPPVLRRGLTTVGAFGAAVVTIWATTGIELLSAFSANLDRHTQFLTYDRSRLYWFLGNIVALLVTAGIATTALLVAETRERWRNRRPGFETVLWATLLLSSALGAFRGETDHNWLFFLPLVTAVAAASATRIRVAAASNATQAIATDALFYTGW